MKNLKIVEISTVLAGPSVGAFFAELGAEVIKIEPLLGDVTRHWRNSNEENKNRLSAYFCSVNFGKKSIALNLKRDEGQKVCHQLIETADIVLVNTKPGDAEKLNIDENTLMAINEKLIYGKITGYGESVRRAGFDAIIQAESGLLSMNGNEGQQGVKFPVAITDILAGHQLKEGILVALLEREKSNRGQVVSVSLIDSALTGLTNQGSNYLNSGYVPKPMGSDHPNIVPYGTIFNCLDEKEIVFAIGTEKQYLQTLELLNIPKDHKLYRLEKNNDRVKNRKFVQKELQRFVSKIKQSELIDKCNAQSVPIGKVNQMNDVFKQSFAKTVEAKKEGEMYKSTLHTAFGKHENTFAPPFLGEHSIEILSNLSYSEKEIAVFLSEKIIGTSNV